MPTCESKNNFPKPNYGNASQGWRTFLVWKYPDQYPSYLSLIIVLQYYLSRQKKQSNIMSWFLNGTWIITSPIDSKPPPMPFMKRSFDGFNEQGRLKVLQYTWYSSILIINVLFTQVIILMPSKELRVVSDAVANTLLRSVSRSIVPILWRNGDIAKCCSIPVASSRTNKATSSISSASCSAYCTQSDLLSVNWSSSASSISYKAAKSSKVSKAVGRFDFNLSITVLTSSLLWRCQATRF